MGWSEPIAATNGAREVAGHERASGTERRSAIASLGKRLPLVGGVVLLLVLGFVAYAALSHTVDRQRPMAPVAKPVITNLSVTPSALSPSPTNHSIISFHVNVDSSVTVMVTDSEGRIIKKLLDNDPKQAGPMSKPYYGYNGATTLSPGRYIIVVSATANGWTATARAPIIIT